MLKRLTYFVVVLSLLLGASCSSNPNTTEPPASATQEQLTPTSQTVAETSVEPTQKPSATSTAVPTETATNTPVPPTDTPSPTSTPTAAPTSSADGLGDRIFAQEWEADFDPEEWIDGSNFPCVESDNQSCTVRLTIESVELYDLFNAPDTMAIPIPDTPWVIEAVARVWTKDAAGQFHNFLVPLVIANSDTEQRVTAKVIDIPLPLWTLEEFVYLYLERFYYEHGSHSDFTYSNDIQDYFTELNPNLPRFDTGDELSMSLPIPYKPIIGNYFPQYTFEFLLPLLDHLYGENRTSLSLYLTTGDINDYADALGEKLITDENGTIIIIPGGGISFVQDKVHQP